MENDEWEKKIWMEQVDFMVKHMDEQIKKAEEELACLRRIRDSYAISSYPGGMKARGNRAD